MEKYSGHQVKTRADEYGENARCHSKLLMEILIRLGLQGNCYTKRLPAWVFEAPKNIRESILRGLHHSDGSINIDKWNCARYEFELANEDLIKDIKLLVQSLGYKSGKISSRLRKNITIKGNKVISIKPQYSFYYYLSENKQTKIHNIGNRKTDEFILEPIVSIEDAGEAETYDIYVENENHNFYANGVVVHNSILEKARRIYKQLMLVEDAMLIYRTSRAPERRVFKVFVGNMDDDDVEAYVQKIANKFKRSPVVDPKTGQVDTRYNQMAVDQDFFLAVRDPNAPNPIDTLPGASNLAEIADVEYIQKKLFTALRVPKPFLGFEDVAGDGKNLALKDIRFARTVNRVQQSMIQELNKIAIIHLFILGFEDDIDNFTLSLNNPSTQADLMRVEMLKEKALLYKDLVADAGNGFGITSMTWAKKNVMEFSEDEIKLDLEQQRLEKAAAAEMEKTSEVIIHTGIFDKIDKIFGKRADQEGTPAADAGGDAGGDLGGGGGGSFGGGGLGDLGGDLGGELGGEAGGETPGGTEEFPAPGETGTEETGGAPNEEKPVEEEGFFKRNDGRPLLVENRISWDINEMLNTLDDIIEHGTDLNTLDDKENEIISE